MPKHNNEIVIQSVKMRELRVGDEFRVVTHDEEQGVFTVNAFRSGKVVLFRIAGDIAHRAGLNTPVRIDQIVRGRNLILKPQHKPEISLNVIVGIYKILPK